MNFDRNHYSVPCEYAGKAVSVRVYAERLVFAVDGVTVAEDLPPPQRLVLRIEPKADCFIYDRLLGGEHVA